MKIKVHKGRPRRFVDWSELDEAIEGLGESQYLTVKPNGDESAGRLKEKIMVRYQGVQAFTRKSLVIVQLKG